MLSLVPTALAFSTASRPAAAVAGRAAHLARARCLASVSNKDGDALYALGFNIGALLMHALLVESCG